MILNNSVGHEDVKNVRQFVNAKLGQHEQLVLWDFPGTPQNQLPTRANILNAMRWLVSNAQPGDRFFFHYSGHGGQAKDFDGDEKNGSDETIVPLDYKQAGQIIDDEMHAIMCANLPQGAQLVAIFDSCHSGTALDLPFVYMLDQNDQVVEIDLGKEALKSFFKGYQMWSKGNKQAALASALKGAKYAYEALNKPAGQPAGAGQAHNSMPNASGLAHDGHARKLTRGTIIQFSGCRDDQTSADATIVRRFYFKSSEILIHFFNRVGSILELSHGHSYNQ